MSDLLFYCIIFSLIVVPISIYRVFKYGIIGLDWISIALLLATPTAVIELLLEGEKIPLKVWIIYIVVFTLSLSMFILIKRRIQEKEKEESVSKKKKRRGKKVQNGLAPEVSKK